MIAMRRFIVSPAGLGVFTALIIGLYLWSSTLLRQDFALPWWRIMIDPIPIALAVGIGTHLRDKYFDPGKSVNAERGPKTEDDD